MTRFAGALTDARQTIPPLPQTDTQARKRRSLSCHDCHTPIPAGTVRCRDCSNAVRREAIDIDQLATVNPTAATQKGAT